MCRTAPRGSTSQKQPEASNDRFFALPEKVCLESHQRAGCMKVSKTLLAEAWIVAFSTTSKPAADLSVTSAHATAGASAAPNAKNQIALMSRPPGRRELKHGARLGPHAFSKCSGAPQKVATRPFCAP